MLECFRVKIPGIRQSTPYPFGLILPVLRPPVYIVREIRIDQALPGVERSPLLFFLLTAPSPFHETFRAKALLRTVLSRVMPALSSAFRASDKVGGVHSLRTCTLDSLIFVMHCIALKARP